LKRCRNALSHEVHSWKRFFARARMVLSRSAILCLQFQNLRRLRNAHRNPPLTILAHYDSATACNINPDIRLTYNSGDVLSLFPEVLLTREIDSILKRIHCFYLNVPSSRQPSVCLVSGSVSAGSANSRESFSIYRAQGQGIAQSAPKSMHQRGLANARQYNPLLRKP